MNSLQIPDSRVSRPVSVSVPSQSQTQSQSQSHSQSRRQPQRASHQVISPSHQSDDAHPAYRDVYSHPAAVAYATAHPRRTIPKFGPYLLLQTLGEGEFGKVKLGLHCQWGEEVAVKLIRRGSVDSSLRMSKVEREIEVLRTLKHPNIVRLYDVIETDKYIGIILEYASGGELFDHILAHRYLKEKDAAKLFSQLISGVWYIHQKKIVHRDLKLENLLLDRHRNVIITDFGFANRFEHRTDDLMQTSCGSPCYAAPELVISEGLYVGSAVDIWSCGVILYAMLAGYLPFDDDPANPDGDNINLLYKYIVNTPLSFPDYVSPEARDLLSMMLVPDPTRRADLRSIMAHPWLAAYASIFSKDVDDLERGAMEQHQMKRLAYQRQMRQAVAAATAAANQQEPTRVARTQSARVDGMLASPGTGADAGSTAAAAAGAAAAAAAQPRSHSYRDDAQPNPEYLYETSIEQSIYSSPAPPAASSRHAAVSLAVSPTTPMNDDPFAPPPTVSIPVTISTPDDVPTSVVHVKESSAPASTHVHANTHANTTIAGMSVGSGSGSPPAQADPKKKGPSGFRHTIQVEYGEPRAPEPYPALGTAKPAPSPSSRDRKPSPPRVPGSPATKEKGKDREKEKERTPQRPTVDVENRAHPPPTPPVKTPGRGSNSTMRDRDVQSQTPAFAVSPANPSGTSGMDDKSAQSGTGSPGSGSGSSRHRKGLSIDKFGLSKIFGSSLDSASANGYAASRVPSESEVIEEKPLPADPRASASIGAAVASTTTADAVPQSQSKISLLSPTPSDAAKEKKNRRNTLTVMVEPFSRSIKNRKGKTPTGETPAKASLATTPITTTASNATTTTGPSPAQAHRQTAIFPSMGGKEGHSSSDNPASTIKARNVMQWFRRRSGAKPDVEDMSTIGDVSTTNVNVSTTSKARNGEQTRPAQGDTSFSFSRAGWRFTTSSLVASASAASAATAPPCTKDVLRIHHGAVDQTTITTRPPPEVMKRICQVLEELGMEFKAESEYKYRCVRAKRKKTGSVGLGFSGVVGGNGLAAFTMVGSAASNGVDKRGLPVPSNPSAGGMLKGLLMRRQSSQVSGPPSAPTDTDDNNGTAAPSPTDVTPPGGGIEPIYGDTAQDAGDEVRFSVELTRIDRLKDTYSVDIRRLKGNLRSYKFLYDTIRERADLQRER
ncbi:Pkinase-domain-containing protein [Scleroderma citrinum]